VSARPALHDYLLEQALQQEQSRLFTVTQQEAHRLLAHLQEQGNLPSTSQIRALANALSPQGVGDDARQQLLRLHSLIARHLLRTQKSDSITLPPALPRLAPDQVPDFWDYVAGRLLALRSGDSTSPGQVEKLWQIIGSRYQVDVFAQAPDAAQLDAIHLRLAQTFLYALTETWEYPQAFTQEKNP
jgi:hypothetical protein